MSYSCCGTAVMCWECAWWKVEASIMHVIVEHDWRSYFMDKYINTHAYTGTFIFSCFNEDLHTHLCLQCHLLKLFCEWKMR